MADSNVVTYKSIISIIFEAEQSGKDHLTLNEYSKTDIQYLKNNGFNFIENENGLVIIF